MRSSKATEICCTTCSISPLHKTASPKNLVQVAVAYFFLQYPGVFFGTVSFPEASLVQSDVTPTVVRTDPRALLPCASRRFSTFPSKVYFFLTQCHGSPWRGRQCTRHLIRWIPFSALLSVLGITLTKCTSLKYTALPSQPWLVDHLVYGWPLYKWRNYYTYKSYYSYNREENHLCEHN